MKKTMNNEMYTIESVIRATANDLIKMDDMDSINAFSVAAKEAFAKHVERIAKEFTTKMGEIAKVLEQKKALEAEQDTLSSMMNTLDETIGNYKDMPELAKMVQDKIDDIEKRYTDIEKKIENTDAKVTLLKEKFFDDPVDDKDETMENFESYSEDAANTTTSIQDRSFDFYSNDCKFTLASTGHYAAIINGEETPIFMSKGARKTLDDGMTANEHYLDNTYFTVKGADNGNGTYFIGFAKENYKKRELTEEEKKAREAKKVQKEAKRQAKREADRQFTANQKLNGGKSKK